MNHPGHIKQLHLILVFIVSFSLFYFGGQNRPFSAPDEGRYVEIPREMVSQNDYITPTLNGVKYFEKPPLFYWCQAFFIKAFGTSESAMRVLPALSGALGVLCVFILGALVFNRFVGFLASGILSTSFLFFALSHIIVIDILFTSLTFLFLGSFLLGMNAPPGKERYKWAIITSVFLALAVLTKGLVALIFFFGIAPLWIFINRHKLKLWPLYLGASVLVFLILVLPWHILIQIRNPEFFDFYIIHEHFSRFLEKGHNRYQPFYFFIPVILFGFLPWTPFLISGTLRSMFNRSFLLPEDKKNLSFFCIWALFIFGFFTLCSSKLITYVLPLFAPLSLLSAYFIHRTLQLKKSLMGEMLTYSLFCFVAIGFYFMSKHRIPPADFDTYTPYIQMMVAALAIGAIAPPFITFFKGNKFGLMSLFLITFFQLTILVLGTKNGTSSSVKSSYFFVKENMPLETQTYSYHHFHHDLPVYAQKPIPLVGYQGELIFGQKQDPKNPIFVTDSVFWKRWYGSEKVCVMCYKDHGKNVFLSHLKSYGKPYQQEATKTQKAPYERRFTRNIPLLCNINPSTQEKTL